MSNCAMLTEFYNKERDLLVKRTRGRVTGVMDAEDCVHDAFVKALSALEQYDGKREIGAWFNTILNRCVSDWHRKNRLQGMTVEVDERNGGLQDCNAMNCVVGKDVINYINCMKGRKRDIAYRRYMLNLRVKDIADIMGITTHGVSIALARFRQGIKDKLGERLHE